VACNFQEATDKWNDLLMSVRRDGPIIKGGDQHLIG
jgi:hypothetical protein